VVRHARANTLLVSIRHDTDAIAITVQDDGVGFHAGDGGEARPGSGRHFGVSDMRRRINSLGGTLRMENGDECGVTVRISVPLPSAPAT
jgi:signal transduction histidine kinase